MRGSSIGNVRLVCAPKGSETQHALDRHGPRDVWLTFCGRDASNYLEIGDQNIAKFINSAYSCKRCARAIIE